MNSVHNNSPPANEGVNQATAAITPSIEDDPCSGPREPKEDTESKHGLQQLGAFLYAEFSRLDEKTIRMLGLFVALLGSTCYCDHKLADRL